MEAKNNLKEANVDSEIGKKIGKKIESEIGKKIGNEIDSEIGKNIGNEIESNILDTEIGNEIGIKSTVAEKFSETNKTYSLPNNRQEIYDSAIESNKIDQDIKFRTMFGLNPLLPPASNLPVSSNDENMQLKSITLLDDKKNEKYFVSSTSLSLPNTTMYSSMCHCHDQIQEFLKNNPVLYNYLKDVSHVVRHHSYQKKFRILKKAYGQLSQFLKCKYGLFVIDKILWEGIDRKSVTFLKKIETGILKTPEIIDDMPSAGYEQNYQMNIQSTGKNDIKNTQSLENIKSTGKNGVQNTQSLENTQSTGKNDVQNTQFLENIKSTGKNDVKNIKSTGKNGVHNTQSTGKNDIKKSLEMITPENITIDNQNVTRLQRKNPSTGTKNYFIKAYQSAKRYIEKTIYQQSSNGSTNKRTDNLKNVKQSDISTFYLKRVIYQPFYNKPDNEIINEKIKFYKNIKLEHLEIVNQTKGIDKSAFLDEYKQEFNKMIRCYSPFSKLIHFYKIIDFLITKKDYRHIENILPVLIYLIIKIEYFDILIDLECIKMGLKLNQNHKLEECKKFEERKNFEDRKNEEHKKFEERKNFEECKNEERKKFEERKNFEECKNEERIKFEDRKNFEIQTEKTSMEEEKPFYSENMTQEKELCQHISCKSSNINENILLNCTPICLCYVPLTNSQSNYLIVLLESAIFFIKTMEFNRLKISQDEYDSLFLNRI
ncbi:hypothetical protein M153_1000147853 [Pseudoloma neurophilia]|uniref:VPS9 domain-containing protein n=1 Tax=Pseudoloma neurophilia TaxID=146866 RepID=A0A0R0M741_9MICR|nr:hypothetical protein M153_1000147853 [Pseudoloma neurophilia]